MSQNIGHTELQKKTRRLLDGPLKHIRVVALAAALLPLASVAPAAAQCVPNPSNSCTSTPPPANQPGTGTPGYWKNHASAWPTEGVTVAGVTYDINRAITLLGMVGSDKSITMFSSLASAILNLKIGNDGSCVTETIALAEIWMAAHPPGSHVAGSSQAWKDGEPLHITLDTYNNGLLYNINGLLCTPHRQ
jgi:hypothetical protein